MNYIRIFKINMPCSIRGFTVKMDVDVYHVYINARLSVEMQNEVYWHEVEHIEKEDYDKFYGVGWLEILRHVG